MEVLASARLSGATRLLSFDERLKAIAVAEKLEVFPQLGRAGKDVLSELRG
jgi:hypothetical protein